MGITGFSQARFKLIDADSCKPPTPPDYAIAFAPHGPRMATNHIIAYYTIVWRVW